MVALLSPMNYVGTCLVYFPSARARSLLSAAPLVIPKFSAWWTAIVFVSRDKVISCAQEYFVSKGLTRMEVGIDLG